ncbi:hypothetical protein [Desertibaculum subflavum]|uniref:hypothetical protein n=1 Tax=Desertibaculum subflavum TaxID=2268458 RepID=UPI000E66FC73
MRFVVRIVGLLLVAAAVIVAGIEMARSFGAGKWAVIPLGKLWYDLSPGSLNLTQALIQRYLAPQIWEPGVVTVLTWPAWGVLGGLGLVLLILAGLTARRS